MADTNVPTLGPLAVLDRVPGLKQLTMLIALAVSISIGVTVAFWAREPGFSLLYSNISDRDAGESLELAMPGEVDNSGGRFYIRVDRVNYSDGSHPDQTPGSVDLWPAEPDGAGQSLMRKVVSDYGNDPANWIAAAPSPGE